MLRKFILLGIFTGGCASLPVFYELNPRAVERWYASLTEETSPAPVQQASQTSRPALARAGAAEPLPGRKVRVGSDASGHFTAEFKFNGHGMPAMVDTGATYVALNRSMARRIGIAPPQDAFIHEVRTANGVTKAATARIERIQIGRIAVEDAEALILDDRALDGALVGMSFLRRLSSFQMENGSLVLQQ